MLIELNQLNEVLVKCEKHLTFFTKLGWGGVFTDFRFIGQLSEKMKTKLITLIVTLLFCLSVC